MQPGIPQLHSAIPVAPVTTNGVVTHMSVPISAQMVVSGAGAPPAPGAGGSSAVIPSQLALMSYPAPATYGYPAFPDPRGAMDPGAPRRSRRSHRHRNQHHRSRRRSSTPSTGSSEGETESPWSSPTSYDSGPKDVLANSPFRPLLSQLPSARYDSWDRSGRRTSMPQPQPQPQPATYGSSRQRRERGGFFSRRPRDQFPMPSMAAAANAMPRLFMAPAMGMPEPQPAPPPAVIPGPPPAGPGPPVIPQMISPHPSMRMPDPELPPPPGQPVIPPGTAMPMPMRNPAPAGSTPFVGPTGLGTPMMAAMPPPGQTMSVAFAPSPSSGHMQMPTPMTGGGAMPMPSPAVIPGVVPPPGNMMVMSAMTMPSPSLGAGAVPQILKFNGYGEFSGLLYHSPHTVLYQEELYPTALHLFEARKFLDHRPDLAERIRQCERVEEVTAISAELADFTRRDWGNVALITVS